MNELGKRVLTGSALALLTLLLIFKSPIGFSVLIGVAAIVVGIEFVKLSKIKPMTLWLLLILTIIGFACMSVLPLIWSIRLFVFFTLLFWLKNFSLVMNYPEKTPNNSELNKAISLFLLITPLMLLPSLEQQQILLLLLIVWSADSFAYFAGKAFGKRKLAPKLSDGKTIEGMIGGLVGVLLVTIIWMFITENTAWEFLLIALLCGIFSVIGDLYESIYKREAGVKDSGNILPGHGGLFDRLDGLLAATPIFIIGMYLI